MTAQKEAGKNAKSGEETKTLSHFSKPNIRYRRGERYELSAEGIATVTLSKLLELFIDQAIGRGSAFKRWPTTDKINSAVANLSAALSSVTTPSAIKPASA